MVFQETSQENKPSDEPTCSPTSPRFSTFHAHPAGPLRQIPTPSSGQRFQRQGQLHNGHTHTHPHQPQQPRDNKDLSDTWAKRPEETFPTTGVHRGPQAPHPRITSPPQERKAQPVSSEGPTHTCPNDPLRTSTRNHSRSGCGEDSAHPEHGCAWHLLTKPVDPRMAVKAPEN